MPATQLVCHAPGLCMWCTSLIGVLILYAQQHIITMHSIAPIMLHALQALCPKLHFMAAGHSCLLAVHKLLDLPAQTQQRGHIISVATSLAITADKQGSKPNGIALRVRTVCIVMTLPASNVCYVTPEPAFVCSSATLIALNIVCASVWLLLLETSCAPTHMCAWLT